MRKIGKKNDSLFHQSEITYSVVQLSVGIIGRDRSEVINYTGIVGLFLLKSSDTIKVGEHQHIGNSKNQE